MRKIRAGIGTGTMQVAAVVNGLAPSAFAAAVVSEVCGTFDIALRTLQRHILLIPSNRLIVDTWIVRPLGPRELHACVVSLTRS